MIGRVLLEILLNEDGNGDPDAIPRALFPVMSAVTLRDERQAPVIGSITVMVPPPPLGESDVDGLVVETHSTCFSSGILTAMIFFGSDTIYYSTVSATFGKGWPRETTDLRTRYGRHHPRASVRPMRSKSSTEKKSIASLIDYLTTDTRSDI